MAKNPEKSATSSLKKVALRYARFGWRVFPLFTIKDGQCTCSRGAKCQHSGKHPKTKNGVNDATSNSIRIKEWRWNDANIGIATGRASGIFVLDIDGEGGRKSITAMQEVHGRLPKTVIVKTGKGRHYYFACDFFPVGNSVRRIGDGIDIRGDGGYVVGAGSIHASGVAYQFVPGCSPGEIEIAQPPAWLLALLSSGPAVDKLALPSGVTVIPPEKLGRARAYAATALNRELDRLGKAPVHQRNDTLNRCAFKLGQFLPYGILESEAVSKELARVAGKIGLCDAEIQATIASALDAGRQYPRRMPFLQMNERPKRTEPPDKSNDEIATKLAELGETDTDNAQRFATRFGARAAYTPGRGWLFFDGKRWQPDKLGQVMELAKDAARRIDDEAKHLTADNAKLERRRFATQSKSKSSLDRMLDLAKSLLAVKDETLDSDPWLLNVENGTIDLRTGHREKHDPRDLLTKVAPVRADRHAKCPLFKKFLKQASGDNAELQGFVQRAVGYSLTGVTSEQVFFFVHGRSGKNGKSTLVNLIRDLLGDYGIHTQTETLLVKQYDNNIPTDLARLAGARMVTAIEANPSRHLDEAKIKSMTGGEPITARFMRQDFFQFQPEFKLWLVANHKPRVRGTDDAFWRRVRLIPWNVTIPPDQVDGKLPEKLRAELPGILAWAIRGCLKWQQEGLQPPDSVQAATKAWHEEMDHINRFVADALTLSPGLKVPASRLFDLNMACTRFG